LRAVAKLAVQGILGGQSPVVTQMARGVVREEETIRPAAKRFYRFVGNERFSHRDLLKGLYAIAQRTVAEHEPSHLVVAVDPVNFEKPYTEALEGVSTVMKSTPPPPKGQRKRLTPGSGDHRDRSQPARAGNHLRQLVLLRDSRLCQ